MFEHNVHFLIYQNMYIMVQTIKTSGNTTLTEVLMCRNKIIGEKITIFAGWKDCR